MKSSSLICQSVLLFFTQMKGICSIAAVLVRGRNSKHQKQYDVSQSLGLKVYFLFANVLNLLLVSVQTLKRSKTDI